jgi:hypothetical protein
MRHLIAHNRREFLRGHARTLENPGALHLSGCRYNHDGVAAPVATSLKQQWDIQYHDLGISSFCLGKELFLCGTHERMHDSLKFLDCQRVI